MIFEALCLLNRSMVPTATRAHATPAAAAHRPAVGSTMKPA